MKMDFNMLIQQISSSRGWPMAPSPDGGYRLEIPTVPGRTQVVNVTPGADPDGRPMAFFWSVAGDVSAVRDPMFLLRLNAQMSYGGVAIRNNQVIVLETQLVETADVEEVARALFYVAKNADELERQAYGTDTH